MKKAGLFATIIAATLFAGSAAYAGGPGHGLPDPGRILSKIFYHHLAPSRHYREAPRYRDRRGYRHHRHGYRRHRHGRGYYRAHRYDRRNHIGGHDRRRNDAPRRDRRRRNRG